MAVPVHGTTRQRAESIVAEGPNPDFREPIPQSQKRAGGKAECFSTYRERGPFLLSPPEEYARHKAALFPDEGGPVILKVDVPDELIALAMATTSNASEVFRRVLVQPTRGVAGLVDDMLMLSREQDLQLDWQGGRCRLRSLTGGWEDLIDVPMRKSVFRAILARIAALCNEQSPDSVSPYGGTAELFSGHPSRRMIRVTFANTSSEQELHLQPSPM